MIIRSIATIRSLWIIMCIVFLSRIRPASAKILAFRSRIPIAGARLQGVASFLYFISISIHHSPQHHHHHHHRTATSSSSYSLSSFTTKATRKDSTSSSNSSSPPPDSSNNSPPQSTGIRINRCFANFASRRESDKFIAAGRVQINGMVAEPGTRVLSGDRVTLDGKTIAWEKVVPPSSIVEEGREGQQQQVKRDYVYIKYWKERGIICTTDESIYGNIISRLDLRERIFPVGRLDKESTGLILLTNDGRVPNVVLRSSLNHSKIYKVMVHRPIQDQDLDQLARGVTITTPIQRDRVDRLVTARTLPCKVQRIGPRSFSIELKEGRNRQIRRMCERLGYFVKDLHRERVMGIGLGGLKEGMWKPLNGREMEMIHAAIEQCDATTLKEKEEGVDNDEEE